MVEWTLLDKTNIRRHVFSSENYEGYKIFRKDFTCLEVTIPTESQWYKDVYLAAKSIESKLNPGKANDSEKRDKETIEIDNLGGVIAEYACEVVLHHCLGDEIVYKPYSGGSFNQIDIELPSKKRTIEVRSSYVRNGIDFALFAKKNKIEQQFDIIGPYKNGYKPGEIMKDYYMRVLYHCDKKQFMNLVNENKLTLYIIGGATKKMMEDDSFYQIKHLKPSGGEVLVESDYRVVPIGKGLDIIQFIKAIKSDLFN